MCDHIYFKKLSASHTVTSRPGGQRLKCEGHQGWECAEGSVASQDQNRPGAEGKSSGQRTERRTRDNCGTTGSPEDWVTERPVTQRQIGPGQTRRERRRAGRGKRRGAEKKEEKEQEQEVEGGRRRSWRSSR